LNSGEKTIPSAALVGDGMSRTAYKRIVVKAGTGVLTGVSDRLHLPTMANLVEQIAAIQLAGAEVLLVSSGAIAAGRRPLGERGDLPNVPFRQVLAAVGQNHLMNTYSSLFDWWDITIAQVLLSRHDLSDSQHSTNVHNTLRSLMERRVVPIINENDVVAVEEIGEIFGDNDVLSALVARLVEADLLILLTDTEGLMTKDPRLDPTAVRVPRVDRIDHDIEALVGDGVKPWSGGGMRTKVEAAKLATGAGVTVVVCDGQRPGVVSLVYRGEDVGTLFAPVSA